MKIKEVIKLFKKVLSLYENAVKTKVIHEYLRNGICYAISKVYSNEEYYKIINIFLRNNYYGNYTSKMTGYLFPVKNWSEYSNDIEDCIKPRLKFLKTEIISLQKLLDKGYTDI